MFCPPPQSKKRPYGIALRDVFVLLVTSNSRVNTFYHQMLEYSIISNGEMT